MVVDNDVDGAIGPRDVSELVESLGFTCMLISGGNDILFPFVDILLYVSTILHIV